MNKNYSLIEFLALLATCSGDEAIDLISAFQNGAVSVENTYVYDVE